MDVMLKKVGTNWEFENETILEDFVWDNLKLFLGLIPIARQYKTSNNQICDILASNKNHQLIILEQLTELKSNEIKNIQILIPNRESTIDYALPNPPKALLNILAKCNEKDKINVLKVREKILSFDPRIQEISDISRIFYGKSKNNLFAELRFDAKRNNLALFLWLTNISTWKKKSFMARMRIWTDWKNVTDIGHVPKGLGRMIQSK